MQAAETQLADSGQVEHPSVDASVVPYPTSWNIQETCDVIRTTYEDYTGDAFFTLPNGGMVKNKTDHSNAELLAESELPPAFRIAVNAQPQVLIMHTHTTATTHTTAAATHTKKHTAATHTKSDQDKKKDKKDKKNKKKDKKSIIPKVYNDHSLEMKDKKETIQGFIYFNQADAAWNDNGYQIKSSGCGPSAMAVCISSLTNKWVTPVDTTVWAYKNGYYSSAGASHEMVPALAQQYKLKCHGLGSDVSKVRDALKKKHPVVALMGPGYFTKKGHFIVLVAIDDNDQVTVADVGSRQRTQYKYPLKEVIAQTKSASAGGPCWEIYSDQKISAKADKKAKQLKAEKKY